MAFLVGCFPAYLTALALAIGEVSYKTHWPERFTAKRANEPAIFWSFIGIFSLLAIVLWSKALYDLMAVMRRKSLKRKR